MITSLLLFSVLVSLHFLIFYSISPNEQREGGALLDFFFFPCSADHEQDWPPCKSSFFRVGNQCAECEEQQGLGAFRFFFKQQYNNNMVINVSVQCNGGLLPDIILLALCDSVGEPF